MKTEIVELSKQDHKELVEILNVLLVNYQIYYQNLRGFHWNVEGDLFFELHEKFEELYTNAQEAIDEIAERILTLGGVPYHTYSDYIKQAKIKEERDIRDGKECVGITLENLKTILNYEKEVLSKAKSSDDEGTAGLVRDYIKHHEKVMWMLKSFLK
ncbi:MAG: Dps family protein [Candidatus Cyclobacteriaceae bacterium M2_1C_046]